MLCPNCNYMPPVTKAEGPGWQSYYGDSRQLLQLLPDQSVDALISDPPYNAGENPLASTSSKYRNSDAAPLPNFDGDSLTYESWRDLMLTVLKEARPKLKPGARVLLFAHWKRLGSLIDIVSTAGLEVKNVAIWDKGRGSRPVPNGFRNQSELILYARNSGKLAPGLPPAYLDGVLRYSTLSNKKVHITQKPVELMRQLMSLVPAGGTVLDPFQGSGSTGVAAVEQGLQYIGIESVEAYFDIAVARLKSILIGNE